MWYVWCFWRFLLKLITDLLYITTELLQALVTKANKPRVRKLSKKEQIKGKYSAALGGKALFSSPSSSSTNRSFTPIPALTLHAYYDILHLISICVSVMYAYNVQSATHFETAMEYFIVCMQVLFLLPTSLA